MSADVHPIDIACGALLEVGRADLALNIAWYDEEPHGYIQPFDDLSLADMALIERAESLALEAIGWGAGMGEKQ